MRFWDATEVRSVITPERAVEALRRRLIDDPPAAQRAVRTRHATSAGVLLLMPDESATHVGVKVLSLVPENVARGLPSVQGAYLLMDAATNSPLALLEAAELTLVRTASVSILAVSCLQPAASPRVVVIGSGPQAVAHADAALRVLGASDVRAVVRGPASAARLAAEAAERGVAVVPVIATGGADDPAVAAVREADVVLCTTSSRTPVVDDADIADHAVVVAIGSHEPDARELPTALLGRATVVVESIAAARAEAGDVVMAEAELGRPVLAGDLAALVRGDLAVDPARPRVFKSVGEAWEDLAIASLADGA